MFVPHRGLVALFLFRWESLWVDSCWHGLALEIVERYHGFVSLWFLGNIRIRSIIYLL
jgi:hypothetical protein